MAGADATITGVDLYRPTGLIHIVDWGVRARTAGDQYSSPNGPSDAAPGTALAWPGFTHIAVNSPCANRDRFTEFAVSVELGSSTAVSNGLQLHYRSHGRAGTTFEPFSISECSEMPCRIMSDRSTNPVAQISGSASSRDDKKPTDDGSVR